MRTNEKNHGKGLVIKDGYPASFRNADGSMKNIYADDGSLTEEGKIVMAAREALSKMENDNEKADKERKRKRKIVSWSVSVGVIVLFLLFFHVYISSDGGFGIYAKSVPTFSYTFINGHDVNDVLRRYNNASVFEQISIRNEPFAKLLFEKGIIYSEDGRNEQQPQNNPYNNEQTEYYKYYLYGESGGEWESFKVKIIFGNKDIKVVASEGTRTFIIVGSPKYDEHNDGTTYKVYYSDNANKDISEITRYKDRTHIQYIPECGEYEIYQKNKPEGY